MRICDQLGINTPFSSSSGVFSPRMKIEAHKNKQRAKSTSRSRNQSRSPDEKGDAPNETRKGLRRAWRAERNGHTDRGDEGN